MPLYKKKECVCNEYKKNKRSYERKNMSIYRLSKETGISDSLLGKILNGKVENPRIQTVKQIAKALNVAINEIVNMD